MAVSVIWDREEGSSLTKGVELFAPTAGVRAYYAKDLSGGRGNLAEAIDAAITDHGSYHPDFTTDNDLPLSHISGQYFGEIVVGAAVSRRTAATPPRWDPFDFATETSYYGGRRTVLNFIGPAYSAVDPSQLYDLVGNATLYRAVDRERRRITIMQLAMSDVLSTHPIAALSTNMGIPYGQIHNAINADAVVVNGITREPKTLKFQGVRLRGIDRPSAIRYRFDYVLAWNPLGWESDRYGWISASCRDLTPRDFSPCTVAEDASTLPSYAGMWYSRGTSSTYDAIPFANKFPTSHGTGPAAA